MASKISWICFFFSGRQGSSKGGPRALIDRTSNMKFAFKETYNVNNNSFTDFTAAGGYGTPE